MEYNVVDHVLIRIRPERCPATKFTKLQVRACGPFEITRKINTNAYVLKLPNDMFISPVFNIEDLISFKGVSQPPNVQGNTFAGQQDHSLQVPIQQVFFEVDQIITHEEDNHGVHRFLIRWKEKPPSEDTWLMMEDLEKLAPEYVKEYLDFNSSEKSSLGPKGIDVAHQGGIGPTTRAMARREAMKHNGPITRSKMKKFS